MSTLTLEEMRTQKVVSLERRQAPIDLVEHELEMMWEGFRAGWGDDDAVTRACMSNLLVYCESPEEADAVRGDLPKILFEHPARTLLLYRDSSRGNDELVTWVSVHFSNLGHGLQVCGEQVDVVCRSNAESILPSTARSLLVSDLPTALWWASATPPARSGPIFTALADIADQVIFDSVGWRDPPRDILALARWTSADQDDVVIHNLAWRRLKPWRRILSEVLAPSAIPEALNSVVRIRMEHGPHGLPSSWLLIGWLADRLGWQALEGKTLSGKEIHWTFRHKNGTVEVQIVRLSEGPPVIRKLVWDWDSGRRQITFRRSEDRKLEARIAGGDNLTMVLSLPNQERATLVAQQLAYRTRDRLFESALSSANAMTQALAR